MAKFKRMVVEAIIWVGWVAILCGMFYGLYIGTDLKDALAMLVDSIK